MNTRKIVGYMVEDTDNRDPQTTILYLRTQSGISTAQVEVNPVALFQNVLDNLVGLKVKVHTSISNQIVITFVIGGDMEPEVEMCSLVVHGAQ